MRSISSLSAWRNRGAALQISEIHNRVVVDFDMRETIDSGNACQIRIVQRGHFGDLTRVRR